MADVYVAFVRDDQSYAEALAVALQGSGFSVSRSASVVEAIEECGAIVVLWTPSAARSKLFIDAADRAFRSGKMVMARMGSDPLPQMFAGVEAHSLARWSGDPDSPEIDEIMYQVDRLVNRSRVRRGGEGARGEAAQGRGTVHRFPAGGPANAARAARPVEPPAPAPYAPQAPAPAPYAPADPLAEEAAYWRRIQHSADPEQFYAYLERYGRNGTFAELAETRLRALSSRPLPRGGGQMAPPAYPPQPMASPMAQSMPQQIPQPMPAPMPMPAQPGYQGRNGFNLNTPVARQPQVQPSRLDPHPARARPATESTDERSGGGGGARLLAVLLFLAVIGGGGFYVYQQLNGPAPATEAPDAAAGDANWAPPPGSPAEPDSPSTGATATEAAQAAARLPLAPPSKKTAAQPRAATPAAEPPTPAPVFRVLQTETPAAAPPPAVRPAPAPSGDDFQREVGPLTAATPVTAVITPPPAPPAPVVTRPVKPRWAQRPSARDLQAAYPAAAQRRNISGRVALDCLIGNDLAIRCRAVSETPAGYGFAAAALRVAQQFRASPTLEDGRPAVGERAQVSILFQPE